MHSETEEQSTKNELRVSDEKLKERKKETGMKKGKNINHHRGKERRNKTKQTVKNMREEKRWQERKRCNETEREKETDK